MNFEDKVEQRYKGKKGEMYHETLRFVPDVVYPWVAKLRRDKIFSNVNKQDIVLEYGVGTGWNIAKLKCKKRLGFDLSKHLKPIVQRHGIEFVEDITTIPHTSIDVIICHHVLEHTSNPPEILKEIRRILCHSGKLLLFVPYEKERRYHHYNPQESHHHLYSWNVQTLSNLVEDIGFKVIEGQIERFGYDRFAAVWASRFRLGEFGFKFIRRSIHFIKPAFEVHIVAIKE